VKGKFDEVRRSPAEGQATIETHPSYGALTNPNKYLPFLKEILDEIRICQLKQART
jgi:hypothetical protein